MKVVNRWLGPEVLFVHVSHGALYVAAVAIAVWRAPWWLPLLAAPLIAFSAWVWFYEARFVLPVAMRLLRSARSPGTTTHPSIETKEHYND